MVKRQQDDDTGDSKRSKVSQADFPNVTLEQASRIAKAIAENFASRGGPPHQIAMALDLSPTSGGWRNLCGSSNAYGLTEGGYNAATINLTPLGRRLVSPTSEGDDSVARVEAILKPRVEREFFQKYDRSKFPRDDIAQNVLIELGLPRDRVEAALNILKANGEAGRIIQTTKTGLFVALDTYSSARSDESALRANDNAAPRQVEAIEVVPASTTSEMAPPSLNAKVFITHGKNRKILEQIKRAVVLGGFEPIVSIQQETPAKPVPQKVLDDMRSCNAAVIHVGAESEITDKDGKGHIQINPNVLIEIGAAMALYKGRFILVVESAVELPSNLQGLYQCRYSGDGLGWDDGMKILEALRGLKTVSA